MKKSFSILSLGLLLGLSLNSCSNEELAPNSDELVEIKLTSAVLQPVTRGSSLNEQSTQITSGQSVGVTITNASAAHNNVQWNVGASGALTNTLSTPIYYGTSAATITAYHPYNAAWTALSTQQFAVAADQSGDGYKNSDLLYVKQSQARTAGDVTLTFIHKLAKVQVNLTSTSFSASDLAKATISICNVELNTGINLADGTLATASTSNVGEIKAAENSSTAAAIVVPQTVASGKILIKVKIGTVVYGYTLSGTGATFESGKVYTYNMSVTQTSLNLNSSAIDNWTNGGNQSVEGGELPYNGYEYVDLGLTSGTLWATRNLGAEGKEDYEAGTAYPTWDEGYVTRENYSSSSYIYKYTKYIIQPGAYNYGTADGLTTLELSDDRANKMWGSTWHMPTKAQIDELRKECTWTTQYKNGSYVAIATKNNKSVVFPLSTFSDRDGTWREAYYWSNELTGDGSGSSHGSDSDNATYYYDEYVHVLGFYYRSTLDTTYSPKAHRTSYKEWGSKKSCMFVRPVTARQ